jgi:hypothetical protein
MLNIEAWYSGRRDIRPAYCTHGSCVDILFFVDVPGEGIRLLHLVYGRACPMVICSNFLELTHTQPGASGSVVFPLVVLVDCTIDEAWIQAFPYPRRCHVHFLVACIFNSPDLWGINNEDLTSSLTPMFFKEWNKERAKVILAAHTPHYAARSLPYQGARTRFWWHILRRRRL